jgi:hypothetical protein
LPCYFNIFPFLPTFECSLLLNLECVSQLKSFSVITWLRRNGGE